MTVMSPARRTRIERGDPERIIDLPDELAPSLREAMLALVAETGVVEHRPEHRPTVRHDPARQGRAACYVCHRSTGPMGGHHLRPGDNESVVPVHRGCHRRLHASGRDALDCGVTQPYPEEPTA